MKNLIAGLFISMGLMVFVSPGFAQDTETKSWDLQFVSDLQKIKSQQKTDGLGYTLSEEEALEIAIKKAMDQKAPPCEAMKLAVDLEFNPYNVITGIFNSGAEIDLEQLCMCATEGGIPRSLLAQATEAAAEANRLTRDEIAQSQCLREGLGYTAEAFITPPDDPDPKPDPYSKSVAGI